MRGLVASLAAACAVLWSAPAQAEVSYRNGLRVTGSAGGMSLNVFIRPRYIYQSDDGSGDSRSTFELNLLGAKLRAWDRRGRMIAQVMGGMAIDEPVLLDSFFEMRPSREIGLRFGYFRVGYDEQTTHAPFWLRMTRRSIDVDALSHEYDLGLALTGTALDEALAFSLSVTNGEGLSFQNLNADFLYAARVALRLAPLFDWRGGDLVFGAGFSWNLEPWEPELGTTVNRSVISSTFDVSGRMAMVSLTAAALYRYQDPGAYGAPLHAFGWHLEVGAFAGRYFEFAFRTAHLVPDLDAEDDQLEVAAVINGFPDEGRLRVQLEYAYQMFMGDDGLDRDAHRVVVQWQALY